MLRSIEIFLKRTYHSGKPLLLGFSGGHDSRVLLELLIESRKKRPFTLLVAHVDHGWREESRLEAFELKEMVERRGLPFFLHTLKKPEDKRNLEDLCREERYAFFQRIYRENDCGALLLGHHADDQAETVLKRLFEGAHFTAFGAMQCVGAFRGMSVWRPLLEWARQDILAYLREKGLEALDDRTNADPAFLRARMRSGLVPDLEAAFGKNFRGNMTDLAETFQEIGSYFLEKSRPYLATKEVFDGGVSLDFTGAPAGSLLEMEVALRFFFLEEGVMLGARHLRQLARQLAYRDSNKKLRVRNRLFVADQGKLFCFRDYL